MTPVVTATGLRCLRPPDCPRCAVDAAGCLVLCVEHGCRSCPSGLRRVVLADTDLCWEHEGEQEREA